MPSTAAAALRPLSGLAGGRGGNVAVEFALAVPVLLLLLLGGIELGRYILLHQKLQRVAISTADLVARADKITEHRLQDVFAAASQVALPYRLGNRGVVIVTAVANADGNGPRIAWQRAGAGSVTTASRYGSQGGNATLGQDFTVREGETAILSEVFYEFEPLLMPDLFEEGTLYATAHFRPRLTALDMVEPE